MSLPHCQVCNENCSKYKCPACLLKYCSVVCYKHHKSSDQCRTVATEQAASVRSNVQQPQPVQLDQLLLPTQDTVPADTMLQLRDNAALQSLLQSPGLRDQLQQLAACSTEAKAAPLLDAWIKQDKNFRRFANACFTVVEPENNTFKDDEEDLVGR